MKSTTRLRWPIFILTVFACVAGFFLRRAQLGSMQPDGSPADGSRAHIYLLILAVATAVALAALLFPLTRQRSWKSVFAYRPVFYLIHLAAAVGLLVGNLLLWIVGQPEEVLATVTAPAVSRVLGQMLAPMGLLAALCLGAFAIVGLYGKKPSGLFHIAATLYLVIRLIVCFQQWNTDPWIHDYCYQLLAAVCCMLAVVQLAGFSLNYGKRRITLFWCLMAALFCSMTVADHLRSGAAVENLINISLLVTMLGGALQLLFCDLRPEAEEAAKEEQPAEEDKPASEL